MDRKRMKPAIWMALALLAAPVLRAQQAQTAAIDAAAARKFGFSLISSGDNIPDFPIREDSKDLLLLVLHGNIPLPEFKTKTGFSNAKIDMLLRFLEEKNFVRRVDGAYKPTIFIADAEDGRRLFEYALPISQQIVAEIKGSLPAVRKRFSRTEMSKSDDFGNWSFFILSDVLLDNWQIDGVEREFLKAAARPLRHGKNYYAAMQESSGKNEPFGLYGNQVGGISIYGNNRIGVKAESTKNIVSAADGAVLEKMAADFLPRLLGVLEKNRPYAEKVYAESGYAKEVTFDEFYIWWYHFIYTRATDLMAEAGMLKVPAGGNFFYQQI